VDLRLWSQPWQHVKRCDSRARELADRHYSRQTPGARDFMPPGRTFVLYREGGVWGVVEHLDPRGRRVWRCSIFRNESGEHASELIRAATWLTYDYWLRTFTLPQIPLTTEVAPSKVRPKSTPGHCFIIAGWRLLRVIPRGHGRPEVHVLRAPEPSPKFWRDAA
jgi:hypothetical protein